MEGYEYYQMAADWLRAQPITVQILITVAVAGTIILCLVGVAYLIKYIFLGLYHLAKAIVKGIAWVFKKLVGKPTQSAPPKVQVQVSPVAAPQVQKRYCPQCGHELVSGAAFCGACGSSIHAAAVQTPVQFA